MSISSAVTGVMRKAAVATASTVIVEVGRAIHASEPATKRLRLRAREISTTLAAKIAVSESAQALARIGARRLPNVGAGRLARQLASRPMAAAGVALFAFDAVKDGLSLGRGDIDSAEFFERSSGNAASLAASSGGAVFGGAVGGVLLPVAGAPVGALLGSVLAGLGGDAAGRILAKKITGDRPVARAKKRRRRKK